MARTYGGSTAIALNNNSRTAQKSISILRLRLHSPTDKSALPTGYAPGSAITLPLKTGELSGTTRIAGQATITATALSALISDPIAIDGVATVVGAANALGLLVLAGNSDGVATVTGGANAAASMSSSVTASATVEANLGAIIPMEAATTGTASPIANLKGIASAEGIVTIGASGYLSNDDVSRLAIAVWDEATADHTDAGTTGKALADAGGAGNPWSSDLSTNNDPNTFGEKVNDLITKTQFLSLKD